MFFKCPLIVKGLRKPIIIFLLGFFVSPNFASAATIVPDLYSGGYFAGDVVWTKADSPYVVTNVIFSESSSLTIEPGAIVKFNPATYGMLVRGSLKVGSSTSTEKVYFTSIKDDTVGGDTNNDATSTLPQIWDGAGFGFSGYGSIDNAVFRYGSSGGTYAGKLIVFGGQLSLSYVKITDSNNVAIQQTAGSVSITDSDISNRCGGVRFSGGTLSITNSNLAMDYSLSSAQCSMFSSPRYAIDNRTAAPISAMNNWWGDPSGPQHPSNPSGTGSVISGNVDFTPWLTSGPFTATICAQNCFSNVLFLPGLEASRLYDSNGKLWEPSSDADAENLFLNPDGTSVRNDVYTKDVIDEAYATVVGPNIYKSFIDQMNGLKTDGTISDWEASPYDWRLSLDDILNNGNQFSGDRIYYAGDLAATSSPYIIQELRHLAKSSKTGKVTVVAHSNGGLVAKALMQKLGSESANLIDKIIFVAVPQVGTPQTIGALLHGFKQGIPEFMPLVLTESTARTLAKNMPSAYNLLPSANYFTYVDDPVVTFDNSALLAPWRAVYGDQIHSKERLHTFVADQSRIALPVSDDLISPISGNETLLNNAEDTHNTTLDNWTPPAGVSLYEIAGWGEETLKTIAYYQGWKTFCSDLTASTCPYYITVPALEYGVKDVFDGDGTVVVPSALWTPTASTTGKWWVDLERYNTFLGRSLPGLLRTKHADILEVPSLRALIKNILINSTSTTPLTFISTSTPSNPNPETRLRFTLHSPLALNLYDDLGNHTGFSTTTGFLEENIPGSRYKTYGELKYIEAPASTTLRLAMNGYAMGSFTLDIEKELGDITLASTTFAGIPSSTTTTATITVPQGGSIAQATPLLVDYDGNGITDFSLKPQMGKTSIFDITPPEAALTFDSVSQKLKIVGTDNFSSTTVSTTAASTVITDEAGNTLKITFDKIKQEKNELKLELQKLRYNGVATTTQKTILEYEWSADKAGNIRELEEKATVGSLKIEGHYDAKKNVTRIERKVKKENDGEEETKEVLPGLVIIGVKTEKGIITMNY